MSHSVLYVLGTPFTGSTLFAAALGTSDGFVNLGEVNFVENDWHEEKTCSCGALLKDCDLWGRVARIVDAQSAKGDVQMRLERAAKLDPLDQRAAPILQRAGQFLGLPLRAVFGEQELERYGRKHGGFLQSVAEQLGAPFVIDCSKTGQRLETLDRYADVDLAVVFLTRDPSMIFASRLKRARRRNARYAPPMAFLYAIWLLYHLALLKRSLSRLRRARVIAISYETFCTAPEAVETDLSVWLGRAVKFRILPDGRLDLTDGHTFTGNIWLTQGGNAKVELRAPDPDTNLRGVERAALHLAMALCRLFRVSPAQYVQTGVNNR